MTSEILLSNFERLAEAPNGISKLRELILQLAVSGKLVPQDPNDEPASELLEKIEAEKRRLLAEGAIRKRKALPLIADAQIPYGLPSSWCWTQLGAATTYAEAEKIERADVAEGTWVLELEDIEKTTSALLTRQRFPERAFKSTKTVFRGGDVLYGKLRPYLDKVLVADEDGVCTTEIIPFRGYAELDSGFLRIALKSPAFVTYANDSTHGMNLPRLGTEKARMAVIPIPPLAEQKHIVAKVDELMALCDDLEAKQQTKRAKQIALNRASLHALTEPNGTSLAAAWHRVRDHFDHLYTVPETVAELRQTILQLAVMGRLVPQDPNDEPASELLKKIQAEKRRLIAEGKIRKTKAPQTIDPDLLAWELPQGWIWSRTADMLLSVSDGDHQPPPRSADGVPFLVIGNVSSGTLDFVETRHVPRAYYDQLDPIRVPRTGDVLYTVTGSYGITVVVDTEEEFCVQRHIAILKVPSLISPKFISTWLNSPLAIEQAAAGATGTAQKTVALGTLRNLQLPLPPLAEQKRIVAKVDKLMTPCNVLEARLQQAQTDADDLLTAIVHELITSSKKGGKICQ